MLLVLLPGLGQRLVAAGVKKQQTRLKGFVLLAEELLCFLFLALATRSRRSSRRSRRKKKLASWDARGRGLEVVVVILVTMVAMLVVVLLVGIYY